MEDIIIVAIVFAIPFTAIITSHFQKQSKTKQKMLENQLELEKLKHDNFLLETEKMKLELKKMEEEQSITEIK